MSDMSVRASLAVRVPQSGISISIRTVAVKLRLHFPVSVRDLTVLLRPIRLVFGLGAGTCSCSCEVTMTSAGVVHYTGAVHNSGALSANYVAITSIPVPVASGGPVIIAHKGDVAGTFSFGSRGDSWDMTTMDAFIANSWASLKEAVPAARTDFGTDTRAFELLEGVVAGTSGAFVFQL
jgi:hypothetical protein